MAAETNRPQGAPPGAKGPVSISIFFPCYNEQDNVARVTEQALAVAEGLGADYEIIIVDDGSSDDTGRRTGTASSTSRKCPICSRSCGNTILSAVIA